MEPSKNMNDSVPSTPTGKMSPTKPDGIPHFFFLLIDIFLI